MGVLYIIRHAETEYNNKEIYVGKEDVSINKIGIRQAHCLGKLLKKENLDLLVTSSMIRAKETANIINQYVKKDMIVDDRFAEVDIGAYEGLTSGEILKMIKDRYGGDTYKFYNDQFPGGEKSKDVEERVYQGLNNIKKNYPDKRIALVTHGFIIRVINKYFNPAILFPNFYNFLVKNAEIKRFNF